MPGASSRARSARTAPPSRPSPRSATPSRSGCARRARTRVTSSSGRPSRSAPTSSVSAADPRAAPDRIGQRLAGPATSATRSTRQLGRSPPRVRTATPKIAPMLARTAFGAYGSAHPGPSATLRGAERQRAAQHRADVARVADARAGTRTAGRPARAASAARTRRSRACPSPASRRRQRCRVHVGEARARRALSQPRDTPPRAGHPASSAAAIRSSPSALNLPARSRSRLACRRRTSFSRWLCGEVMVIERVDCR